MTAAAVGPVSGTFTPRLEKPEGLRRTSDLLAIAIATAVAGKIEPVEQMSADAAMVAKASTGGLDRGAAGAAAAKEEEEEEEEGKLDAAAARGRALSLI